MVGARCVLHNICEINNEEFNEDWLDNENLQIVQLAPARIADESQAVTIRKPSAIVSDHIMYFV